MQLHVSYQVIPITLLLPREYISDNSHSIILERIRGNLGQVLFHLIQIFIQLSQQLGLLFPSLFVSFLFLFCFVVLCGERVCVLVLLFYFTLVLHCPFVMFSSNKLCFFN